MEDHVIVSGRQECHPLHNTLILDNIFKFLLLNDLKQAREVCTKWNDVASPYVQEISVVKLDGTKYGIPRQFLEEFENVLPEDIFFRNYQVSFWVILQERHRVQFWKKFGFSMKRLELRSSRIEDIEVFRKVLFYWTPGLRKIYLENCFVESNAPENFHVTKSVETKIDIPVNKNITSFGFFGGPRCSRHQFLPLKWEEIFIGFPHLKEVQVYNITTLDTTEMLEEIFRKQATPSCLKIEKLMIFRGNTELEAISIQDLELLSQVNIKLKYLHIDIGTIVNQEEFSKFLEKHSKSLKTLKMFRGPLAIPLENFLFKVHFPFLTTFNATDTVADSLHFLEFMPNLKELGLIFMVDSNLPLIYTDIIQNTTSKRNWGPFPKLTKLNVDYSLHNADLLELFNWFPNITKLRMHLDDISFPSICQHWTKLEDLEVLGCKVTNNGILGQQVVDELGNVIQQRPYHVLNLIDLRKFKMLNSTGTALGDVSIFEGFRKLKKLVHFELCSQNVSQEALQVLRENSKITTLILTLPEDLF